MVHIAKRNLDRCPIHPGALLRQDLILATGRTKVEIARLLGISRQHLYDPGTWPAKLNETLPKCIDAALRR